MRYLRFVLLGLLVLAPAAIAVGFLTWPTSERARATGGNVITSPDTGGVVGLDTSLALDASGNPVISYTDYTNFGLKVLHCNDPNCSGGDEIPTSPDTVSTVFFFTSLALDAEGFPVVSSYGGSNDLKVLHCNDPYCEGSDESTTSPDPDDATDDVGQYTSLALDCPDFDPNTRRCISSPGNPVVSYYDDTNQDLKLLHCNDPNCSGGDESPTVADTGLIFAGWYTSLVLDGIGKPVVSYWGDGSLKVLHCNDPNCSGGDESPTSPDMDSTGFHTSLVLDGSDPVVSSYGGSNGLKLLHCNDPNCDSAVNGPESITSPDPDGATDHVGWYTSLVLDAEGFPVVSYYDATNGDLKVLHCGDPNCEGAPPATPTPTPTPTPAREPTPTPTPMHTPGPTPTPTPTPTPCQAEVPDTDGDGYDDCVEQVLGTNPALSCPLSGIADDEEPDAWPPDFNDDQIINILDVDKVLPPYFGTTVPPTSPRRDLKVDGFINILDVDRVLPPTFGSVCTAVVMPPLKLGHTNDLAGTGGTPYGIITTALNAYFDKVNDEDGGVCGRDITLIAEDDQYAPGPALEKTRKLVEQDQVLAMVGAVGTAAHLGAVDYLNDPNGDGDTSDGIPDMLVSSGFTGWGDYSTWPWTTGYIPDYHSDGAVLAQYINENQPGQHVGILYQNDPFGENYRDSIAANLADPALLVSEQSYEPGAPDLSAQVINIQGAGAEVVVLASVPTASAAAIVAANGQGYSPQWMVSYVNAPTTLASLIGGGTEPEQLAQGFALLDGTISNNYQLDAVRDADDPAMVEHARIMDTYSGPGLSTLSVYGQSMAELTVDVLSRACVNLTRDGLMQAVESTQGFSASLFLPGIDVNFSSIDHYGIQTLQPVRIEADGSLTKVGSPISAE